MGNWLDSVSTHQLVRNRVAPPQSRCVSWYWWNHSRHSVAISWSQSHFVNDPPTCTVLPLLLLLVSLPDGSSSYSFELDWLSASTSWPWEALFTSRLPPPINCNNDATSKLTSPAWTTAHSDSNWEQTASASSTTPDNSHDKPKDCQHPLWYQLTDCTQRGSPHKLCSLTANTEVCTPPVLPIAVCVAMRNVCCEELHWQLACVWNCFCWLVTVLQHGAKTDRGKIIQDSEVCTRYIYLLSLDEIHSVSWSSNHVGESEGTCLLRFSLVFGKEARSIIQKRMKNGKARWEISNNPASTQCRLESMSSSGIYSHASHRLRFSKRSSKIWKFRKGIQNSLTEKFSESRCSATWDKEWKLLNWIWNSHEGKITRKDHSTVVEVKNMVWNVRSRTRMKMELMKNQMIDHFQQSGPSVFQVQVRSTEESWTERNKRTLTIQTLHSRISEHWTAANHFSIELVWWVWWKDAWSDILWLGQVHLKSEWSRIKTSESVRSWFHRAKTNEDTRSHWKQLAWSFRTILDARSLRTIPYNLWISWILKNQSVWMYYRTGDDMNKRIWKSHSTCREYILLRARQDYLVKLWIQICSLIRPVLEFKICCHLDIHGIEIEILSASGDNTNFGVFVCRDWNRYVNELRCKDQECSPENPEEAEYGHLLEIDAEQRTFHSRPQCTSSDDTFLVCERNCEDMTANEANDKDELGYLKGLLDKWYVTKIAVTEMQMELFIGDWHVRSWKLSSWSMEEILSLIKIGSTIISGRATAWHDFSIQELLHHLIVFSCYPRTH